jgi:hypothetical protein
MKQLFGEDSYLFEMLVVGLDEELVGWGREVFEKAKRQIWGAIKSGLTLLDEMPAQQDQAIAPAALSNEVFVVHGHDDKAKGALEILLTEMGLTPIYQRRISHHQNSWARESCRGI